MRGYGRKAREEPVAIAAAEEKKKLVAQNTAAHRQDHYDRK
jgi:hypothetical protein